MAGLHHNYTTERDTFRRVEVITGVARRRRWPRSEKARIVAESFRPAPVPRRWRFAMGCIAIRSSPGGVSFATARR